MDSSNSKGSGMILIVASYELKFWVKALNYINYIDA